MDERLKAVEEQLGSVKGELGSVKGELGSVKGQLGFVQEELSKMRWLLSKVLEKATEGFPDDPPAKGDVLDAGMAKPSLGETLLTKGGDGRVGGGRADEDRVIKG